MLSIDITDRQIKLVRGIHSGSKIRVQDADLRELTLGMVANGYITDVPMVAAELSDIIKTKEIKEKEAIVSITSSSIVYKELLIPKPKSLKNTAAIEAMIQSEMSISNEYNISFTIAGEVEDEEKNKKLKVIAAACPQRLVDGYVRLFSHIGLSLKAVNISNNSVTRLILNTPKMAERMPILLIQIDQSFLNMNLYEDNQLVFSRYFSISPVDYDNAPDYVTRATYDNLFKMLQFIKSRKGAEPLKEIMFYGEIANFVELSNAISSFNVPTHVLAVANSVVAQTDVDYTKYANAIGAIYRRNKELEHINLLEASSAKESKGMNGFLLGLVGGCIGAAAIVFGVCAIADVFNNTIQGQIQEITNQINDPVLQSDISIVDQRTTMLSGFQSYNDSVGQTSLLFNYMPKPTSYILGKLKEPISSITADKVDLDIESFTISDYSVTVQFKGLSNGDPSYVPSEYAEKLITEVKDKNGDPYFQNVVYSGFTKENASTENKYVVLSTQGSKTYDTVFSFSLTMNVKPGSDEANATISFDETAETAEVTE